jgi:hypothetical protein
MQQNDYFSGTSRAQFPHQITIVDENCKPDTGAIPKHHDVEPE